MLLKDFINFNPKESLSKDYHRKISMDQLKPFQRFINSDNYEMFSGGAKFRNGDTIMARITPCLENGKTAYVDCLADNEVAFGSTEFIVARAKRGISLPLFIYYLLCSTPIRNIAILSMTGSSGRERVQQFMLDNYEIPDYSIEFQQHIVDTIGSVDNLIEKYENIFKKFQELLQDFYKSKKEKVAKKIELSSLIQKTGKLLKNNEWKDKKVIDLSSMPQKNIVINDFSDGVDFSTNIKKIPSKSLLYGSIRPYFRKCGFAIETDYCAGTVHSFLPYENKFYLWLLAVISSDEFHNYTEINSQGTKMPMINWETFIKFTVPIPQEDSLFDFNKKIEPIFNLVVIKMKEYQLLKKQKEILLKKYFG